MGAPTWALSRVDNKSHVCQNCGRLEGMWQWQNPGKPVPPLNVTLREGPQ